MELVDVVVSRADRAVVRVGNAYLKIETNPQKAAREHDLLHAAPVPVPEILWWSPGEPSLLALRAAAGAVLEASNRSQDWVAAGAVARQLHDSPRPAWKASPEPGAARSRLDADRDRLLGQTLLEGAVVHSAHRLAAAVLTDRMVEPVLIHGDLQAEHVFVEQGRVTAIIDWGDVGLGDPLYDVAVLSSRAKDRLGDVCAGYGPVDADVVRGWWAERHLAEVRWLVEHGDDPDEAIDQLRRLMG